MNLTKNKKTGINGLILAGGQSTRMGQDKSLISFHGKPQREHLATLLGTFCDVVYLSCKKDVTAENLPVLADQYPIAGPLNGILSAFDHHPDVAWLTVPVDMPWVDDRTLGHLISNRDKAKTATCFLDSDGKDPEPLLTLWEPAAYPLLKAFYNTGKSSPRDFLKQSNIKLLTVPDQKMLLNINTTEALKKYISERDATS